MKNNNIVAGFFVLVLIFFSSNLLASVSTDTIDTGTYLGRHTSIAIDFEGNKHISYYENDPNYDLKYAFLSDASTTTEAVDTTGDVGLYTSIDLDSKGNPHISYIDATNNNLKYTYYDGSSWQIETVGAAAQKQTSIKLDASDTPHIAYAGSSFVKYTVKTPSGWSIEDIDPGNYGSSPDGVSLALDRAGNPHISYAANYPYTPMYYVHYIYKENGGWVYMGADDEVTEADCGPGEGGYYPTPTSLALDKNGNAHVAHIYLDTGVRQLRYVNWTGTKWSTQTIGGIPGSLTGEIYSPSIALDGTGNPIISYYTGNLTAVRYDGSAWATFTLDNDSWGGDYGRYSSIVLSSGTAHLSYQYIDSGFTVNTLKYALWTSTHITPVTSSPQNFGVSSVDTTQINWQWGDVNDEIGYNVLSGTSAPFEILAGTATLGADVNSWAETGLSVNTPYIRFVQAVDEGNVKNSTPTTRYTLPAVSAGINIQDRTATSISIGWDDGSNPSYTRWQVLRSTDDFLTKTSTVTAFSDNHTSLTLSDSGLNSATTYYYKVRPINEDGLYGAFTLSVSTLTLPPPPNAPSTFTATALSTTEVRFDWGDESNDELGFRLLNSTFGVIKELGADTTYWVDSTLTPNTTSQVRYIRSYHADSASENIAISTNPFTFTNAPGNPQISVTTTTIDLSWENNSNPSYTRWEILRSSTNFSSTDTLKNFGNNFTDVSFSNSNLTPDTTYQYKIRALNEDGVGSTYSSVLEGLTVGNPGKITGLSARQDSGSKEILISWTSPGDNWYLDTFDTGSLFKIQYSTDPAVSWSYNSAQTELDASGTSPGAVVSTTVAVGEESTYYIKVWAKDDMDNWSVASDSASVYASRFIYQDVGAAHSSLKSVDLALSGGYPHVAYRDDSGYLKYGKWNTGSENFDLETVESEGIENVSIDIDSSGNPHLSYYNTANKELRYAKWTGIDWATQTLRTVATGGGDSAVIVDAQDNIHIAFAGDGIISYHKWDGVNWSTASAANYVGTGGGYDFCDLAVDARGYPHISFYTHQDSNHALKYTTWDGSSWQTVNIDAVTNNLGTKGEYNSITLDKQGLPRITYWDYQNDKLKYAYKSPGNTWSDVNLDDSALGGYSSIALDGSDNPAITYFNNGLRYLKYDGSSWNGGRIDGGEGDSAIKLDISGRVHAAYINNNTVRYAKSEAGNTTAGFERPLLLSQTNISSITWSWTDLTGETGYNFYNSGATPFSLLASPVQNASSVEDTGLAPNTVYYRFLQAVYAGGVSNSTQAARYTRAAPPVSLQFGEVSDVDASFSWGANSNPSYTSWKIMRSTDGFNTDSVTLKDAADNYTLTDYTAEGLNPQTTYFFRVYAYNEEGYLSSGYMEISTETFVVAPLSPTGFSGTAVSSTTLLFGWADNATDETGYKLKGSTGALLYELGANTTYYYETGLGPNELSDIYSVTATGMEVDSGSSTLSGGIYSLANSVSGLAISSYTADTITLDWSANSNPSYTRWEIVRSSDAFASSTTLKGFSDNFTTTIYTDTGLQPYTAYIYRVSALNENGRASAAVGISTATSDAFVSSEIDSGEYPSLAVDSSDNLHVVYYDGANTRYALNTGSGWTTETVETGTEKHSAIDADSAGAPHLLYRSGTNIHYSSKSASGWSTKTITEPSVDYIGVSPGGTAIPSLDIKVDSNDNIHIAYYVAYTDATSKLQYKKWDGNSWTSQTISTFTKIGSGLNIAFNSLGNPYISFIDANDINNRSARYARFNGSSWIMESGYNATNSMGWESQIALDSSDHPWVIYNVGGDLQLRYASWDSSGTFTQYSGTIDSKFGFDIGQYPSMVMDTSDKMHLIYNDDNLGQIKYSYGSQSDGFSFQKVSDMTGEFNLCSVDLDSYGNPHVVYSTASFSSGSIYYAEFASPDKAVSAPSNFTSSTATINSITWSWNDVSNEVYYSLITDSDEELDTVAENVTTWTETGLSPNTLYTRAVKAVNGGESGQSSVASAYTLAASPTSLSVDASTTSAVLSWSSGGNPAGTEYGVQRSTDNFATASVLKDFADGLTDTSFTDTSFTGAATYYYRVKAFNGSGTSTEFSSTVSFYNSTPQDPLYIPAGVTASEIFSSSITIAWSANGNSAGTRYGLQRSTDNFTTYNQLKGLSDNFTDLNFTDTGLLLGNTYYYRVRAFDSEGVASDYSAVMAYPHFDTLYSPTGLSVADIYKSSISITWTSFNEQGTRYGLERSTDNFVTYTELKELADNYTELTYVDINLAIDSTYYYRVKAYDSGDTASDYSSVLNYYHEVDIYPPAGLSVSNIYTSSITISWTANGNDQGTKWGIQRSTDNFATSADLVVFADNYTSKEYTDTALIKNNTYYYRVNAYNYEEGKSSYSSILKYGYYDGDYFTPRPAANLEVVPADGAKIDISWEKSVTSNASRYNLYYATYSAGIDYSTPQSTFSVSTLNYTTPALTEGVQYFFVLRTQNKMGNEEKNTNVVSAETLASTAGKVKAVLKSPVNGTKISGDRVMIEADLVLGVKDEVQDVTFELKLATATVWQNIAAAGSIHANPDTSAPYFIYWDASVAQSGEYNLRAVAKNTSDVTDSSPGIISLTVDHADPDVEQKEEADGSIVRKEKIDNRKDNAVKIGEKDKDTITELTIPQGALDDEEVKVSVTASPSNPPTPEDDIKDSDINHYYEINLDNGQTALNQSATIRVGYEDKDNDGKVDGTEIAESGLSIYHYNGAISKWEKMPTTVDKVNKHLTAQTDSFSFFGVFGAPSQASSTDDGPAQNLNNVFVYPNPYKPGSGSSYDAANIRFKNLTAEAKIRIFNIAGELVVTLRKRDGSVDYLDWAATNKSGKSVASGIYIYSITNDDGDSARGKLGVIR